MSLVTIVMATYNGEKYVEEQVKSILSSTYQNFHLHIYDDGSTDHTLTILRGYEERYPDRIKIFQNEENLGVTRNFLQAINQTTTDYIMLCDQDDVWNSDKIHKTLRRIRHMEAQRGKEMPLAVFTDAVVVDQDLKQIHQSFFQSGHLDPRKTDLPHLLMENKLIGCTVMINAALRRILQRHNIPKEARFHDWWLALLAASFGGIGYMNEGTILYRQHGGNVVGNTGFLKYIQNRIRSLSKQKETLLASQRQAGELLILYGSELPMDKRRILEHFSKLNQSNFIRKRIQLLRFGFFKTGILRNIGLMFII